ncbi:MAG TPA: transglutaminase domain-containing protein, partial [Aequorivita sp.]|nr:transglutaminase domain-containing protein [Aequorivita sp.]
FMRKQFIIILFFCFGLNSFAQIGAVIGKDIRHKEYISKKQKPTFSTEKLAVGITKNAKSDNDKVLAIYKWITSNISYDHELRLSSKLQKEFYTSEENVLKKVLERKMALCGGYAFLFKNLCKDVGVSAEVIHGFTKDYSGRIQQNTQPNHTWNAVKLNGRWQLLDLTWAISYGSKNKPDNYWFLTKPADFILSHYPQDRKWILLGSAISFSEFQKIAVR